MVMSTHNAKLVRMVSDKDDELVLIQATRGAAGLAMLFDLEGIKTALAELEEETDINALEVGVLQQAPQVIVPGRGGRF